MVKIKRIGAMVSCCALIAGVSAFAVAPSAFADIAIPASNGAMSAIIDASDTCEAYDLDGDGTKDTVDIDLTEIDTGVDSFSAYSAATLTINDVSISIVENDYFYYPEVSYLKLADDTALLNIRIVSDSDYPVVNAVYQYDGGSIKRVLNCNMNTISFGSKYVSRSQGSIVALDGNKIVIGVSSQPIATGIMSYQYKFAHQADGTFTKTTKAAKAKATFVKHDDNYTYSTQVTYSPTLRKVRMYSNVRLSSSVVLPVGTKAKVTGVYFDGSTKLIKIKVKGGSAGYIKATKSGGWDDVNNCSTGQIFKWAMFVG